MADRSAIEWTDATYNVIYGCTEASPGCAHCYARTMSARFNMPGKPFEGVAAMTPRGPRWTGLIKLAPERLMQPLRWKRPRMIFVNSVSDTFHEDVPFEFIDKIFAVMALTPHHTYQVLTKRPERMAEYLNGEGVASRIGDAAQEICQRTGARPLPDVMWIGSMGPFGERWILKQWPLQNVWVGTSVENQKYADERIPHLLRCPAAIRFLSCEPLLGPVDLSQWFGTGQDPYEYDADGNIVGRFYNGIGWLIGGGESGPGARPCHPDWARSLRDQCVAAGVPYFWKQWGEWVWNKHTDIPTFLNHDARGRWTQIGDEATGYDLYKRVGKKTAGALLDGQEWRQMPQR